MSGAPTLQPVEQLLVSFLKGITGKRVGTHVPNPRPPDFVVLRRSGGARRNLVQADPVIFVEVWGSSATSPTDTGTSPWPLAKQVWEALAASDETGVPGLQVMSADVTLPVDFPDEASGAPRYTFIFTPTLNQ